MATVTSSYAIGVTIDADGTGFVTGTEQAQQAMTDLATTTQAAAADIDTTLTTDVPASVDSSAVSVTTKATKFKAVGTELGTALAGGISGGASGKEAALSLGNSVSGLLAASAATGVGAAAAVGIGLGTAIIGNVIKGINAKHDAYVAAFNDLFKEVEVEADGFASHIKASILDALTFQDAIAALGGDDGLQGGLDKVNSLVEQTGANFNDVVDIIRGQINPETRDTVKVLRQQADATKAQFDQATGVRSVNSELNNLANEILDKGRQQQELNGKVLEGKRQERDYQAHLADDYERSAAAAERIARATEDAAAASGAIATGLQNALAVAGLGDTQ